MDVAIATSRKADAARRQLGTALHLFLFDLDPISVHSLAASGGEIAERLAKRASGQAFASLSLEAMPELTEKSYRAIRNARWNALKHATDLAGVDRNDEDLLASAIENDNAGLLLAGWYDLGQAGMVLPIEAQVFVVWYLAKYPDNFDPDGPIARNNIFPGLPVLGEDQQKEALRSKIEWARGLPDVMQSDKTDLRPLVLPA